ncbi:MAG: hypothetical protein H7Y02_03945 [Candidatus Obscuribacterales bacterium]|nr:hypothetical protein [Steroidobacteraceae bacterium]
MLKQVRVAVLCLAASMFLSMQSFADADLTEIETKWLRAAEPVLEHARQQGLAIDVIVRPDSKAGDVPLSMGVRDQRCKLVLAMRNNPDAEKVLLTAPATQHAILIEAMTAHEVAHCWRFANGIWHALPAGFVEATNDEDKDGALAQRKREMRATQREEGFADLVGLAWTQQHHPEHYEQLHTWLTELRSDQPLAGSYHDTRVWIALAKHPSAFTRGESLFDEAFALWIKGLRFEH